MLGSQFLLTSIQIRSGQKLVKKKIHNISVNIRWFQFHSCSLRYLVHLLSKITISLTMSCLFFLMIFFRERVQPFVINFPTNFCNSITTNLLQILAEKIIILELTISFIEYSIHRLKEFS